MNNILMEELLNEEEGTTLDFKCDQYLFEKATDDEKSELLKDILSFANAWRRSDAYILVGVEDVKGGRSKVIGVTRHFDDASIQQFVNAKTNQPMTFSYEVFPFEGAQVGVFHIPIQDRPVYLRNDFGKLKRHEVYLRRGSSTAMAAPDEIAKMGSVSMRELQSESLTQVKIDPVVAVLKAEQESGNMVLVENVVDHYNKPRFQCKVVDVNNLYANFRIEKDGQEISGSIKRMSVSYEPVMKMKLFTIAPIT
jgi:predicted HTH transcriptional regulator